MVLVDTSVWIRFLNNNSPYAEDLETLLQQEDVASHELVYGELLIGDRRGRRQLLAAYELIQQAISIPHREVVEFVRSRNLNGRSVGWVDIHLLASALVERFTLWTANSQLLTIAEELGVAYQKRESA